MTPQNTAHADARAAGFSPARSARWVAYLAMKARRGQTPISLQEAVEQVRAADARR